MLLRGGLLGKTFVWGDDASIASEYAHLGSWKDGKGTTKPVGNLKPNEYGLFDMAGNVFEWCQDWNDKDYYNNSPAKNPLGPSTGSFRVVRGGSWGFGAGGQRVAYRQRDAPLVRSEGYGFRCVSDLP